MVCVGVCLEWRTVFPQPTARTADWLFGPGRFERFVAVAVLPSELLYWSASTFGYFGSLVSGRSLDMCTRRKIEAGAHRELLARLKRLVLGTLAHGQCVGCCSGCQWWWLLVNARKARTLASKAE